jgi:hypothetical protein
VGVFPEWMPWLVLVLIVVLAAFLYLSDRRDKKQPDDENDGSN